MHDSGARDAADSRQRAFAMRQQSVDKRAFVMRVRRMHDHARRLVQHQQIAVFVNNVQRDVFGRENIRHGRGFGNRVHRPRPHFFVGGRKRFTVFKHRAVLNQRGDAAAGIRRFFA